MDELEISGKRYISTRRAAKDNKYHSDYIGQLIRAGKVEGQKVGRSWYVGADSLADYLGKEGSAKVLTHSAEAPVKAVVHKEKIEEPKRVELVKPKEIEETAEAAENKIEVEEILGEEKNYIPVKITQPIRVDAEIPAQKTIRGGLRYMADDGPLYPRAEREMSSYISARMESAQRAEEVFVVVEEEPAPVSARPKAKNNFKNIIVRSGAALAMGAVVLAVVAAASAFVVSTTTVQGDTASVGYTLAGLK